MKASEIIRKIADVLDAQEAGNADTEITNRPDQQAVNAPNSTSSIEDQAQVNTKSMVAPLQQKLELMKKLAGEETCETCGQSPCACDSNNDELSILKRNAGVPTVVIADDDEPFEG